MSETRVMHVITGTALGGAEMMLLRYLRAMGDARAGHVVVSMMPPGALAAEIAALGVPVRTMGVAGAAGLPAGVMRLVRLIRAHDPQVLHCWMYHGCLAGTLAVLAARRGDIGLLWGMHHSLADPRREKRMTRAVFAALRRLAGRADVITYCSRVARDQHRRQGLSDARDRLIPNAIDCDEFRPDPQARARLSALAGIPPGRLIVGSVGRNHPMKDHAAFARCIAALVRMGHDVHGVVIGGGQPGGPAERQAAADGIADRLSAIGPRQDIPALVPGFDLYLLSSAWGESMPLAVAEALASGVPAVVTDVGDSQWLVGEAGAVCPPCDSAAMAQAASRILSLPAARRAGLGSCGRERMIALMSMPHYVELHETAYRDALVRRAAPSQQGAVA